MSSKLSYVSVIGHIYMVVQSFDENLTVFGPCWMDEALFSEISTLKEHIVFFFDEVFWQVNISVVQVHSISIDF